MRDSFGIAFSEASTWRGLVLIITALGIHLDPAQIDAIVAAGLAVNGLIAVFTRRHV